MCFKYLKYHVITGACCVTYSRNKEFYFIILKISVLELLKWFTNLNSWQIHHVRSNTINTSPNGNPTKHFKVMRLWHCVLAHVIRFLYMSSDVLRKSETCLISQFTHSLFPRANMHKKIIKNGVTTYNVCLYNGIEYYRLITFCLHLQTLLV